MICLLPHCGYLSETSRMLEIYRALKKRGATVRIATHGGTYESALTEAGVPYDLVGPRMSKERCAEFVRAGVGMGPTHQSMYADEELRIYARAEAEYFRAHQIQIAVTGFTLTTLLSTRLTGTKLVTEHAGCWVPPAFERGLLPAPTLPAFRFVPERLGRWLANAIPPRMHYYCSGFNRIAKELGVQGVPSLPALLMGDLTLVPEIPEVLGIPSEELAKWEVAGRKAYRPGTRLRYTGPLFARLEVPLSTEVENFLNRPGPVVYVAITSSSPKLVRRVVRELSVLDARLLVAATAHDLGDLACDRIRVGGVLPSHLIMPRVNLAVTAGGQGSLQTAMAAGTPVLGIPLQAEQDFNIALLERLGAARGVAPRFGGTPTIAEVADQMLRHDSYRQAAQRIQRLYDSVDGADNAAVAIIDLVDSPESTRTTMPKLEMTC